MNTTCLLAGCLPILALASCITGQLAPPAGWEQDDPPPQAHQYDAAGFGFGGCSFDPGDITVSCPSIPGGCPAPGVGGVGAP